MSPFIEQSQCATEVAHVAHSVCCFSVYGGGTGMSIRIVVAGKYALPVEILARYLDTVPDFSVVGSVKQHDDLLSVVALVEPAVVVVETGTMDDDVLGVLAQLRTAQPQCRWP